MLVLARWGACTRSCFCCCRSFCRGADSAPVLVCGASWSSCCCRGCGEDIDRAVWVDFGMRWIAGELFVKTLHIKETVVRQFVDLKDSEKKQHLPHRFRADPATRCQITLLSTVVSIQAGITTTYSVDRMRLSKLMPANWYQIAPHDFSTITDDIITVFSVRFNKKIVIFITNRT